MARWQKPHHDCAFHTHSSNCDGRIYHPAMWTLRFAAPANCSAHHLLSTHATAIVRRKIVSIGRKGRFRCCNRTVVGTKRQRYINTSPETRSTNQPKHKFCKSLRVSLTNQPRACNPTNDGTRMNERLLRTARSRKRRSFVAASASMYFRYVEELHVRCRPPYHRAYFHASWRPSRRI